MPTICIVSPTISPRLQYVCELIFGTLLSVSYELSDELKANLSDNIDNTKIYIYYNTKNYKPQSTSSIFLFQSSPLLVSEGIDAVNTAPSHFQDIPILFAHQNAASALPFDIFAAAFYIATRYEEYLPYTPDRHGRFSAAQSVAAQQNFLHLPIVSIWTLFLAQKLFDINNNFIYQLPKYQLHATYDIDIAYAYTGKNIYQTIGRTALDLLYIRRAALCERIAVWRKQIPDPFDTFSYIITQSEKSSLNTHHIPPIFFFLLGDYSQYDKNISHNNSSLIRTIQHLHTLYSIGIHPSYRASASFDADTQLQKEIARLQNISQQNVTQQNIALSRQHYLRLRLPDTYTQLLRNGITHDYTMGYADALGFRAGIAVPFRWFNLHTNTATALTIVPFCAMDTTLRAYLRRSPQAAITDLETLAHTLHTYGGQFGMIWHNSSLSDRDEWQGWRTVYEAFLKL